MKLFSRPDQPPRDSLAFWAAWAVKIWVAFAFLAASWLLLSTVGTLAAGD